MQENTNNQTQEFNIYPVKSKEEESTELTDSMFVPLSNEQLGINNPDYQPTNEEELDRQLDNKEIRNQQVTSMYDGAENKNPSALGTIADVGKGLVEGVADGLVVGSWAGLVADENTINLFETQTAAGDFTHTAVKYIVAGALAFSSGSALGLGLKGIAKAGGRIAISRTLEKGLLKNTARGIYKGASYLTKGGKLKAGSAIGDILKNKIFSPRNLLAGAYADYMAYDPHEGHLADILNENDINFNNDYAQSVINYLSSDLNDTVAEAKLKNVVEGMVISPFIGVTTDVIAPRIFKAFGRIKNAVVNNNVDELFRAEKEISTALKQNDTVAKVQKAIKQGTEEGRDPQEIVRELVTDDRYEDMDTIIDAVQKGEKVIPAEDGTFHISVEKWQDGYKVNQEDFGKQFLSGDVTVPGSGIEVNENIQIPNDIARSKPRYNSQKINFESPVDMALYAVRNKKTKSNRHDDFMGYLHQVFPNQSDEQIRAIGNNVFTDFKEIAANSPDDISFPTTYKKYIGNHQTMPKSVYEMEKGYSEILAERGLQQVEGEDTLQYFNKIADDFKSKNGLADSPINIKLVKNIKGNHSGSTTFSKTSGKITIKINEKTPNPLYTLRAELEHARDFATGDFNKKADGQHFFRYGAGNEEELPKEYLHKKAVSRAITEGKEVSEDVLEHYYQKNPDKRPLNLPEDAPAEVVEQVKQEIKQSSEQLKLNFIEEHTSVSSAIDNAKTADEAIEVVGEYLTKEGAFSSSEAVRETVERIGRKAKTRTHEEAVSKGKEVTEFLNTHLDESNFNTDELKAIVNNELGKSEKVSDTILGFCETLIKLKSKTSELNRELAKNPNSVEILEKISNLTDTYSYIDKAILNEKTQAGRALGEIKLFNKAYKFFTQGEGFERNYTSFQRQQIKSFTQVLSDSFEESLNEFFTLNKRNPTAGEMTETLVKKIIAKSPEINIKDLDLQRLNSFSEHILKSIGDKSLTEQRRIFNKYFRIYAKSDSLETFAQGVNLTSNITGMHALKKNFGSNLTHYYVSNILSSPGTQFANGLSGVVNMVFENGAKAIGGIMSGNHAMTAEASDTVSGYLRYLGESWQFAMKVLRTEEGILADTRKYGIEISPFEPLEQKNIKPLSAQSLGLPANTPLASAWDLVGGALRGSGRIMATVDELLSQLNYRGLAWADSMKKARQDNDVLSGAISLQKKATEIFGSEGNYFGSRNEALNADLLYKTRKMIYQNQLNRKIIDPVTGNEIKVEDTTWVSEFGNHFEQMRLHNPALKFVYPFIRTPFNILEQITEYTPVTMLTQKYKALTGQEKALADAKMAMGGFMIGSTALLALNGNITGGMPTDDKQRKILSQSGWQPYSFVSTNPDGTKNYISYKRVEPLASIIGLGADIANLINMGMLNDADMGTITKNLSIAILHNAMDKSYMSQGLDILDILTISNDNDAKKMQRVLNNFASGFLPASSAVGWFRNTEYVRETRAFVDMLGQRSIFANNDGVMPSRNYFGELRPLSGRMFNMVSRKTTMTNDDADREIIRLAQGGATIITPKRMLGNDNEIDMTMFRNSEKQTAYDKVLETMSDTTIGGKKLREAVNELVNSDYYQSLPDGLNEDEDQLYKSKKKAVNAIIQKYTKIAQKEVLQDETFTNPDGISLGLAHSNWKSSRKYVRLSDELNEVF